MTETQATSPEPTPTPAPSGPKIIRAGLPDLLATLLLYSQPAVLALEQAFRDHADKNPGSKPVVEVVHFDAVCAWCRQNAELAARIVLAAVYLANGSFLVQLPPEPEAGPADAQPEEVAQTT